MLPGEVERVSCWTGPRRSKVESVLISFVDGILRYIRTCPFIVLGKVAIQPFRRHCSRNLTFPSVWLGPCWHPKTGGSCWHPKTCGSCWHPKTGGSCWHPKTGGSCWHPKMGGSCWHPKMDGSCWHPKTGGSCWHPKTGGLLLNISCRRNLFSSCVSPQVSVCIVPTPRLAKYTSTCSKTSNCINPTSVIKVLGSPNPSLLTTILTFSICLFHDRFMCVFAVYGFE